MKTNTVISEVELSYEELKCLEAYYRTLQKDAVVDTIKQAPSNTVLLLGKILSKFRTTDQLKSLEAESGDRSM